MHLCVNTDVVEQKKEKITSISPSYNHYIATIPGSEEGSRTGTPSFN